MVSENGGAGRTAAATGISGGDAEMSTGQGPNPRRRRTHCGIRADEAAPRPLPLHAPLPSAVPRFAGHPRQSRAELTLRLLGRVPDA